MQLMFNVVIFPSSIGDLVTENVTRLSAQIQGDALTIDVQISVIYHIHLSSVLWLSPWSVGDLAAEMSLVPAHVDQVDVSSMILDTCDKDISYYLPSVLWVEPSSVGDLVAEMSLVPMHAD